MFTVEDIKDVLARLHAHGAALVSELEQYQATIGCATYAATKASSSRRPSSSAEAFEAGHDPDDNPEHRRPGRQHAPTLRRHDKPRVLGVDKELSILLE
jgi:hypothetical protein